MDPRCENYRPIHRYTEIPGRRRGLTEQSAACRPQKWHSRFGRPPWYPSALKLSLQLHFGCVLCTLQPCWAMVCLGQAHGSHTAISVRIKIPSGRSKRKRTTRPSRHRPRTASECKRAVGPCPHTVSTTPTDTEQCCQELTTTCMRYSHRATQRAHTA